MSQYHQKWILMLIKAKKYKLWFIFKQKSIIKLSADILTGNLS